MSNARWRALLQGLRDTADAIEDVTPEACDGHVVKKGDTLWSLSKEWGVTVDQIKEANPGLDPNNLDVGDCIERP
jgi:LysM repeat protein